MALDDPSPKFQLHEAGLPVDVSVNCTVNGAGPDAGFSVKPAVKVGGGGATPSALARFNRPPLMVLRARLGNGSVLLNIRWMICRWLSLGKYARNSATAPVTCAAAIEVPSSS